MTISRPDGVVERQILHDLWPGIDEDLLIAVHHEYLDLGRTLGDEAAHALAHAHALAAAFDGALSPLIGTRLLEHANDGPFSVTSLSDHAARLGRVARDLADAVKRCKQQQVEYAKAATLVVAGGKYAITEVIDGFRALCADAAAELHATAAAHAPTAAANSAAAQQSDHHDHKSGEEPDQQSTADPANSAMPMAPMPFGSPVTTPDGVHVNRVGRHARAPGMAPQARRAAPSASTQRHSDSDTYLDHPDRTVVERAVRIVEDLLDQSRHYTGIDWAVGAYERDDVVSFFAVGNEGIGYLPAGVRWNSSVGHVFDPTAPSADVLPWRGLANPARIVADHFALQQEQDARLRLVTIVSTTPYGSAVAADLTAHHATMRPPVYTPAPDPALALDRAASTTLHRLDTVDPSLHERITGLPGDTVRDAAYRLAADAVLITGIARAHPTLGAAAAQLPTGTATMDAATAARTAYREFTAAAHAARITDERAAATDATSDHEIASTGGVSYAGPFWCARACAILTICLEAVLADRAPTAAQLADIVYEHYCITEDLATVAEILS